MSNMLEQRRTSLDTVQEANARMLRENRSQRPADFPEPATAIDKVIAVLSVIGLAVLVCIWAWRICAS